MKFESTCENCILAELSNEDLELLKLSYDELDYSDERVRDTLRSILDEASAETGIMLNRENEIRIDVMPDLIGGCLIIFSKEASEPNTESNVKIFETDDYNNLLDSARTLKNCSVNVSESELYRLNDTFRLIISNSDEKASFILSEYLDQTDCDTLSEERTREYWTCLIKTDALKILCGN